MLHWDLAFEWGVKRAQHFPRRAEAREIRRLEKQRSEQDDNGRKMSVFKDVKGKHVKKMADLFSSQRQSSTKVKVVPEKGIWAA